MEIPAATLAQVRTGRDGRRVLIEDDVLDVARRLREIDPRLALQWNESGEFFCVVEVDGDRERLVTTALELDGRLIQRLEEIARPGYDYAGELDRLDREARARQDREFSEQMGEKAEHLLHALRKDVDSSRIIVPKGI